MFIPRETMDHATKPTGFDQKGHVLFWSIGVLASILPYFLFYYDFQFSWFQKSGHFADNLIITIRHSLIGMTLGGWAWLLLCRNHPIKIIPRWANRESPINWIWFFFSVAVYSTHNILLLTTQSFGGLELFAIALGRFFTAAIVISLIWAAAFLASSASPRKLRYVPWFIPACIPGFLAIDVLVILFWNNSLLTALNKLDEQGSLNFSRQLAAGGFDYSFFTLACVLVGAFILFGLLIYFAHRLSLIKMIKVTPKKAALFLMLTWALLFTEKATGFLWKNRHALRLEERLFQVHLTPIEPDPGVASFAASFKPPSVPEVGPGATNTPDIIFIMIESLRADAIDPAHSPFLAKFRDEESQSLGKTWAASNATHLSWFSTFNGQLPNYWVVSNDAANETGKLAPPPWISLLEANNYRREVRGVCDFQYGGMSATNFGLPYLLDVQVDAPVDGEFYQVPQPERELEIIAQSKKSLQTHTGQPHFQFIALDAPHFGYEWHPDFTPPYSEYDPAAKFNAFPSESDIRRVKNRYLNAIAWVDSLVEDYLNFLKEQNRYDDAIIIISGDHGEEFQEHGSWFHCSTLHPEQTSVPIMIKWPEGTYAPPQPSTSHLDLLPSLMDFMGCPTEEIEKLPGYSVLRGRDPEPTKICVTSFCGINGVSMVWRRKGYEATFRWDNPWASKLPELIYLSDITGPDGSLDLEEAEEWNTALHDLFPDAFERYFTRFEFIPGED